MASEQVTFSSISATTAAFNLGGGLYVVDCIGSNYGTVTLQRLGPDGSTYMTAITAFAANGSAAATFLPPGTYKVAISSATAVSISITRVDAKQ